MAVKVVRYRHGGSVRWGVVEGDGVSPIEGDYPTTRAFMLEGAERAREPASEGAPSVALSEVEILCPITRDRQFLCQAINYHSHMRESGFDPASNPFNIFFRKASSCLAPGSTDIVQCVLDFFQLEVPDNGFNFLHISFSKFVVDSAVHFRPGHNQWPISCASMHQTPVKV
jgi:2-keto-4-pentenoate hydratase/2-oxohepta-3-ene-1,7-dioic acid hydratase in catechol pathway